MKKHTLTESKRTEIGWQINPTVLTNDDFMALLLGGLVTGSHGTGTAFDTGRRLVVQLYSLRERVATLLLLYIGL